VDANPQQAASQPSPSSRKVIVIGGGLAGSSAALALARAGIPVTLVEAKSRLGGRAGSYTDQISGKTIDYCQHVGMGCCTNLKQLIGWLGQSDLWHTQRELYFYGPTGQPQTLRALPWVPAPLHLSSWLARWPGLNWGERLAIGRAMLALNRVPLAASSTARQGEELDDLSAAQWLRRRGQSARALERFWGTIVVSALGEELERVGLRAVAKVFQDGFLRHRDAFHLLVPKRPLGELFGSRLAGALARAGAEVQVGAAAAGLDWESERCRGVRLDDGRTLEATEVVVAVPWHALSRLVGDAPLEAAREVGLQAGRLVPSPISGVHTWWDRRWLPTPHAVIVGRLCQWVFSQEEASEPNAAGGVYYQIVISASRGLPRGDAEEVRRLIQEDLQAVFPAARQARLNRIKVVTDPQAVFSVAPGTECLRPAAGSHVSNLYWAGDWTRTGWPATMEGAVLSGLAAAESVAAARGINGKFVAPPLCRATKWTAVCGAISAVDASTR
jgi:squalene-associated FAD-dependent desaturase